MRVRLLVVALVLVKCITACTTEAVHLVRPPSPSGRAVAPVAAGIHMSAEGSRAEKGPDGTITTALREETIHRLLRVLTERYVFPDKAAQARDAVIARVRRGDYGAITTGNALASALTSHVNEVLRDAHFRVRFSPEVIPEDAMSSKPSREEQERLLADGRRVNGGFQKAERLPGNLGYIEVRSFSFIERGVAAAAAAMGFVADTDALIIDVRRNGGGEPDLVAALCSYFFPEPTHLNDLYFRPENETRQFWTSASVAGPRYLDRDVYVLIGRDTFSGAEEFAYNLKQLKRATLVGETTGGGAHPGEFVRLSERFSAFIPTGRAINPITKTNWEGVGVEPDIRVPADDALRVAQIKALEKRVAASAPADRALLEQRLRELRGK